LDEAAVREEIRRAASYAAKALSQGTTDKYFRNWLRFERWCQARNIPDATHATDEDIAIYLSSAADQGLSSPTLDVHLAAIRFWFRAKRKPAPDSGTGSPIGLVMAGIRREKGRKTGKKAALTADVLQNVVDHIGEDLAGLRDRAILLFGYASAMRRSEIVAIEIEHLDTRPEGIIVTIPRSKSDQVAAGARLAVPKGRTAYCPIEAIHSWITAADIIEGPIFRRFSGRGRLLDRALSGQSVAHIVKRRVELAGEDPSLFSGHSLRRGWATDVAAIGAEGSLRRHLRHRDSRTSDQYVEEARFSGHPGGLLL